MYIIADSEFYEKDVYWNKSLFVFNLLRGLFCHIVLFILNFVVIFKYKQYLKSKNSVRTIIEIQNIESNNNDDIKRKELKLTKMIFALNCNFLIGNLPVSLVPLFFNAWGYSTVLNLYTSTVNLMTLFTHTSSIFWYSKFNPVFRKTLVNLFMKAFSFQNKINMSPV